MSRVSLKELELNGLKNQNENLEILALKREQEKKAWEAKYQELQTNNDKLMKQNTVQSSVHRENDIIWDSIISESSKLRPYLDYVLDK